MPGLTNLFVPPIRNRSTCLQRASKPDRHQGVRQRATIDKAAADIRRAKTARSRRWPSAPPAAANIEIDRAAVALWPQHRRRTKHRGDASAATIGETIEADSADQRAPPRELRDSVQRLRELPIVRRAAQIPLGSVAQLTIADGPPMIKSEAAPPAGSTSTRTGAISHRRATAAWRATRHCAGGIGGMVRAVRILRARDGETQNCCSATLAIIFVLLYLTFGRFDEAALIWSPCRLCWRVLVDTTFGHAMSIATAAGFIALAGVGGEFGVIMLLYPSAWKSGRRRRRARNGAAAIREGAVSACAQRCGRGNPVRCRSCSAWHGLGNHGASPRR